MWNKEDKQRVDTILDRCMPEPLDTDRKIKEMLE